MTAFPPSSSTSRRAASRRFAPRAISPMRAPALANACAVARPTPADPPVMTTRYVGDRGKDAARDAVPLDLGEPELHLIEPRAVGRRVVHRDAGMRRQKRLDLWRLVGGEVVGDRMARSTLGLGVQQVGQERDELAAGVPGGGLAEHRTDALHGRRVHDRQDSTLEPMITSH